MMINLLELFAGSRSVGLVAEELKINVFSVDWQEFNGIDLSIDIGDLNISDVPFIPDIIWASPDCTTYSIASCSTHRINSTYPKSEYARKCDTVNEHVVWLIDQYLKINPNLKFFIENPRGMMRKMEFVKNMDRATVTYCSYGDDRMKPTDIFTNHLYSMYNPNGWIPKPMCWNNNIKCNHEKAPRGSKTGTQGKNGSYDRSKIPKQLCFEILNSVIKNK